MPEIPHPLKATLLEAFHSASALLPPALQSGFVLIGGVALLSYGGMRSTDDVDVAVTPEALHAFYKAAAQDTRFHKTAIEGWEYTSTTGIVVPFEFVLQGGSYAPVITAARAIPGGGGGLRASLAELVVMKARAWVGREEESDLEDLRFLLESVEREGQGLGGMVLTEGDEEAIVAAGEQLGRRHREVLSWLSKTLWG